MKKLIPIAVIAVFGALSMVSCKKSSSSTGNYTCTCTYKWMISGSDTTMTVPFNGFVKATAQTDCDSEQTLLRNVDSAATCSLK